MATVWNWFLDGLARLFDSLFGMIIINNLDLGTLILINIILIILLVTFRRLTHAK